MGAPSAKAGGHVTKSVTVTLAPDEASGKA